LIVVPFAAKEPTVEDVFWFLTRVLLWAIALIFVCYLKGEKPKWQWGIPEESGDEKKSK
jgi:hypothetical protein